MHMPAHLWSHWHLSPLPKRLSWKTFSLKNLCLHCHFPKQKYRSYLVHGMVWKLKTEIWMTGNGIVGCKVMRRDGIDNDRLDPLITSNYQFSINLFAIVPGFHQQLKSTCNFSTDIHTMRWQLVSDKHESTMQLKFVT